MIPFDDVVLDNLAKVLTEDVKRCLFEGRKKIPAVPDEYDVGVGSWYADRGLLIRLRITGGGFTVREEAFISARELISDQGFSQKTMVLVSDAAAKFVLHFDKPQAGKEI